MVQILVGKHITWLILLGDNFLQTKTLAIQKIPYSYLALNAHYNKKKSLIFIGMPSHIPTKHVHKFHSNISLSIYFRLHSGFQQRNSSACMLLPSYILNTLRIITHFNFLTIQLIQHHWTSTLGKVQIVLVSINWWEYSIILSINQTTHTT